MPFETFAERKRRESQGGQPEVYIYDKVPAQLRHQIGLALSDGIGTFYIIGMYDANGYKPEMKFSYDCWKHIDKKCREGVYSYLTYKYEANFVQRVTTAINEIADIEEWISIVEICCMMAAWVVDHGGSQKRREAASSAITKINHRFRQHRVGYQFENGRIIRKDSELMHAEVIKPALALLSTPAFAKANEEFMTAHRHYRTGTYKDAVTAANRAFESMLKAICELENWTYGSGDTAARLVAVVTSNGLFTHDFDASVTAYVAMLKAGLPTVRNNAGGHGEGLAAKAVTSGIARFAINLTASNIILLGDSYAALKEEQRRSVTP
jgi:AbiJ N-terminal domain 4